MGLFDSLTKKKKRRGASASKKEEIIFRQGKKCKKCKVEFSLRIRPHYDHKDGDRSNNESSNLQALCPNCHDQKSRRETKRRINKKKSKRDDFGLGSLINNEPKKRKTASDSFDEYLGDWGKPKKSKKKKSSDSFDDYIGSF